MIRDAVGIEWSVILVVTMRAKKVDMNHMTKVLIFLAAVGFCGCGRFNSAGATAIEATSSEVYKTVGKDKLNLYIFAPDKVKADELRPAIVFFFGGGWSTGSPKQFETQARYFASRGMVAITVDYRVRTRHNAKVTDCVADARSAVRWVRANSKRLGIDPDRIAASGGSAGGHLAASTAFIDEFDEVSEDKKVSAEPNALILFNPALILAPLPGHSLVVSGAQLKPEFLGAEASRLSPGHHVQSGGPPTIIFHGRADATVPYQASEIFTDVMKSKGNSCTLYGYADQGHGFFNQDPWRSRTLIEADEFLGSLGWIEGKPTLKDGG